MMYQPKRSTARWLEGAPRAVLACYDSGPRSGDRYMVLYGAPLWTPEYDRNAPARVMSATPFSPCGIGLFVEVPAWSRNYGRKIRFLDLPPDCQRLVIQDCKPE
jgi:hypothetical protein